MGSQLLDFSGLGVNTLLKNSNQGMKISPIYYKDIETNEKNYFRISDIDTLMNFINDVGLRQSLEVMKISDDKYKIISGERRYTAIKLLIEKHARIDLEFIPCTIVTMKNIDLPLGDELKERYNLLSTNKGSRNGFTMYEELRMVDDLKMIYGELKKSGYPLTNTQREYISKELDLSNSHVQRLDFINKNLQEPFIEMIKKDLIPLTVAVDISKLDCEDQEDFFIFIDVTQHLSNEALENFIDNKTKKDSIPIKAGETLDEKLDNSKKLIKVNNLILKNIFSDYTSLITEFDDDITLEKKDYDNFIKLQRNLEKNITKIKKFIKKNR